MDLPKSLPDYLIMKNLKKIQFLLTILSLITFFSPANAEIKVVASIKPIHSLASYLMDCLLYTSDAADE